MAKKKKCPETKLSKAEEISKQYGELSKCCELLSDIAIPNDDILCFREGWRVWEHTITGAGIDIEEIYAHIGRLANKRRAELECELVKLET